MTARDSEGLYQQFLSFLRRTGNDPVGDNPVGAPPPSTKPPLPPGSKGVGNPPVTVGPDETPLPDTGVPPGTFPGDDSGGPIGRPDAPRPDPRPPHGDPRHPRNPPEGDPTNPNRPGGGGRENPILGIEGQGRRRGRVVKAGDVKIPGGGTLVKIRNPAGSDADAIFGIHYRFRGVDIFYEIGDRAAATEIFGPLDEAFDNIVATNQRQFDQSGIITVGSVDEVIGSTESLDSQYERELRALQAEGLPPWIERDKRAMQLTILGQQEEWSQDRLYSELAKTEGFQRRFGDLSNIAQITGTKDIVTNVNALLGNEESIRAALVQFRGPNTNTRTGYVSSLAQAGWQPSEVTELLELERDLVENPEALGQINQMLVSGGFDALDSDDFVAFLREGRRSERSLDYTPSALFEEINDALRQSAFAQQGIDVSDAFARSLGTGASSQIGSIEQFRQQALQVAQTVADNFDEIQAGRYGLTRDAVVRFAAGEGDADTGSRLRKLARERNLAAQGFSRSTGFTDNQGRLRIQGFADL